MPVDDGVEVEQVPQPAGQIDVAEATAIGPTDLVQPDAHDVRIVGQRYVVVIGKQTQLLGIALTIVKDDCALPAAFLIGIELAEMGDHPLARPRLGANALDQSEVSVFLASLGADVAAEEHPNLQKPRSGDPESLPGRFPLHRIWGSNRKKSRRFRTKIFEKR